MPSLTTVSNGQSEVGRRAAAALLSRLRGEAAEGGTALIAPVLRVRQSSGYLWPDGAGPD